MYFSGFVSPIIWKLELHVPCAPISIWTSTTCEPGSGTLTPGKYQKGVSRLCLQSLLFSSLKKSGDLKTIEVFYCNFCVKNSPLYVLLRERGAYRAVFGSKMPSRTKCMINTSIVAVYYLNVVEAEHSATGNCIN